MPTALLVFSLVLVHWFSHAQKYRARQLEPPKYVSVPLIVEKAFQKAFQKAFPTASVDSCYSYPSDLGKVENDKYLFHFGVEGRPKEAWFDGGGKLTSYFTTVALDTLPRRVRKALNEYCQRQQGHVGTIYQKYELKQGYAEVDLEDRSVSYSFAFDVVARGGRAFVWEISLDEKGREPNPKFR